MKLDHLVLKNYRNYAAVDTTFSPEINVLIGANAQGKTNLLESIYVLALARSHRTNNDKELIRFGSEFARVSGQVSRQSGSHQLELIISHQGKRARIDRIEQPKLSQYLGHFNVILFAPEDLAIVKGSPAGRRRFIDMEFGQMSPKYLYNLSQYKTFLKQRNAYLKQLKYHQAKDLVYLDVLTDSLAAFGAELITARAKLLETMSDYAATIQQDITKGRELSLIHIYLCLKFLGFGHFHKPITGNSQINRGVKKVIHKLSKPCSYLVKHLLLQGFCSTAPMCITANLLSSRFRCPRPWG